MNKKLSRYWLLLGITALAVAGLFSLILVIARTPSLSNIPIFNALFHKSLVVHVDLSVLLWFLSIACLLWSLLIEGAPIVFPLVEEAALLAFAAGMVAIALSPLDSSGMPLMSNYVPVITSPVFFVGVSLVFCGVTLMLARALTAKWSTRFKPVINYAIFSGGLIAAMAGMAFIWSYHQLTHELDGQQYYELAFWGGGHTLQFVHTQMLMICWLLVMWALKPEFSIPELLLKSILSIGLLAALAVPFVYMVYDVNSVEHRSFFTKSMIMVGGIAPSLLALFLIPTLWATRSLKKSDKKALWSSLVMSVLLFIYGGVLGGLIAGQNVVIPAHYHGSIVGITLAFMGAAYLLLPEFGYRNVAGWKMAFWQPIIYGGGQLLHISGLAWSGGYGVLRKTPGGMDNLSTGVKAAMGMMGLGGLIAIIGGFMFVIVAWKALSKPKV